MSGKNNVEMRIVRLPHGRDLPMPEYQSALAAGLDLIAAISSRCAGRDRPRGKGTHPERHRHRASSRPRGPDPASLRSCRATRHHRAELSRDRRRGLSRRGAGHSNQPRRRFIRCAARHAGGAACCRAGDASRNRRSGCAAANRTRCRWARLNRTRHRTRCGIRQQARLIAHASEPFVASDVSLSSMSVLPRKALLAIAAVIEVALQGQRATHCGQEPRVAPWLATPTPRNGFAGAGARRNFAQHSRAARRLPACAPPETSQCRRHFARVGNG